MLKFPERNASNSQVGWMRAVEENLSLVSDGVKITEKALNVLESAADAGARMFARQVQNFNSYLTNIVKSETKTMSLPLRAITDGEDDDYAETYVRFAMDNVREAQVTATGGFHISWSTTGTTSNILNTDVRLIPWDSGPTAYKWDDWDITFPAAGAFVLDGYDSDRAVVYNVASTLTITLAEVIDQLSGGVPAYDEDSETYYMRPVILPYTALVVFRLQPTGTFFDSAITVDHFESQVSATATTIPDIAREGI